MTFNEMKLEELAGIEHERWSDWQKYLHGKLKYTEIGTDQKVEAFYLMTADDYEKWERQINTDYKDLSEQEKESDREQVRRYLPIIKQALVDKEKETLERVMKCIRYTYESKLGQAVNRKCDGNEGFNLGVKSSYHDSKRRLEEEFKQ